MKKIKEKILKKYIEQIDEFGTHYYYETLKDAAKHVNTSMDLWKVEMLIVNSINKRKKAFKSKWFSY